MLNIIIEKIVKDATIPKKKDIEKIVARSVIQKYNCISLFITFVNKELSQEYNLLYRGKNYPTNVISLENQQSLQQYNILEGHIIICIDIIRQEAMSQNKSVSAHLYHMLVHSMLHLQGYDHINDHDAKKMERKEIKILKLFDIGNPYKEI